MLCSIGKSPDSFQERRVRTTTLSSSVSHANKWLPALVSNPNFLTIRSNSRAASGIDLANLSTKRAPHGRKIRSKPFSLFFEIEVKLGDGCLKIGNGL